MAAMAMVDAYETAANCYQHKRAALEPKKLHGACELLICADASPAREEAEYALEYIMY